ncbi:MAG TPA: hypothetical protein VIM11_17555 [Tepidisphaeraceae bacterium]|jgi:hypothetical protein
MNTGHLKQKAMGFVQAIETMTAAARARPPSLSYALDYNKLHAATAKDCPELIPILPPEVEIVKEQFTGELVAVQCFNEILAYCRQIVNLLP